MAGQTDIWRIKQVRALSFDLDETLLDGSGLQESIVRACEMIAAKEGLNAVRLIEANGEIWRNYWPEVEEEWTLGELDGASVSLEAWRRTLRACGCGAESAARRAAGIHAQLGVEAHRLFDDVRELFIAANKSHVPLALVTNGASDTQREKLRVLEVGDLFDLVVISGETGIAKPDPGAFDPVIEKLSVEPDEVWHVGDSLRTDVAGAKAAGLTAGWLNRKGLVRRQDAPEPDIEIHRLSDLTVLLLEKRSP